MHIRKSFANIIDTNISTEDNTEETLEADTIDEYKKLNEKCDAIICKIKTRKNKKTSKQIGS